VYSFCSNPSVEVGLPASARDPAVWNTFTRLSRQTNSNAQRSDPPHRESRPRFAPCLESEDLFRRVQCLTAAIDAKDSCTAGHSERVSRIAVHIGRRMDLPATAVGGLLLAGLLHDVGKVGIRNDVLLKPGRLTEEEQQHLRTHVLIGDQIISTAQPLTHLRPGVRSHHERYDGTGYPDGLAREAIPLAGRILAVADSCDAMMSTRRYRDALPPAEIEFVLLENAGSQWDPIVIHAFMACRLAVYASVYDDISRGGNSR
jgi:HD-GYP domain-containing protein (c-di-GMP phosphodiesterase class II)